MSVIRASVTDQVLKITEAPVVASGGQNEVKITFTFCEKWDGCVKTAIFYRDEDNAFHCILDEENTCVVPWEVCYENGTFYIGVFGDRDNTRRTSTVIRYRVKKGAITEDTLPSDPTPDVYNQIIARLDELGSQSGGSGGSGGALGETEKTLMLNLFRNAVYTDNMSATIAQLEELWSSNGESGGGDVHSHSYTSSVTTVATCTTSGVRTYTCSCGHSYTESISATGHKWNNGVVTVEPTEEKEGVRTYTCTVCGETYTQTIAALGHEHNYVSKVIAPTCTEQGYTEHTCACGDSYKNAYVSATGHNYVNGVCSVCGQTQPDTPPSGDNQNITFTQTGNVLAVGGVENITIITQRGSVLELA